MTVKRIKFKYIQINAWTSGSCLIERKLNSLETLQARFVEQGCRVTGAVGRANGDTGIIDGAGRTNGRAAVNLHNFNVIREMD